MSAMRAPAIPTGEVWVTRSAPGSARTAEALTALGFEPVLQPLLTVRAIPGGMIPLRGVGALAFTSANSVTAFIRRSLERALPVFAIGAGTLAAAREAAFLNIASADGDVADLAAAILARREEITGAVLHPCAVERARDLEAMLRAQGMAARSLPVYETTPLELPAGFLDRLPGFSVVTLHSAKAARYLAEILKAHPAPHLRACCLSRQIARPLRRIPLLHLSAAARPTEAALIDLFRR